MSGSKDGTPAPVAKADDELDESFSASGPPSQSDPTRGMIDEQPEGG